MTKQLDIEKEAKKRVKYALNTLTKALKTLKDAKVITEDEYKEICVIHYNATIRALY